DYATGQYVPAQFTDYVTGQTFTKEPIADVIVHEGQTDPLLSYSAGNPADLRTKPADPNEPLSYVQFARIGLGLQRSQIGGGMRVPPPGRVDVGYHLYGSHVCDSSQSSALPRDCHPDRSEGPGSARSADQRTFFDGIDTSLGGLASVAPELSATDKQELQKLQVEIDAAANAFAQDRTPAHIAPRLANALQIATSLVQSIESSRDSKQSENLLHELRIKRAQLNEALALALGLQIDATASGADQVAGSLIPVWVKLNESSQFDLTLAHEAVQNSIGASSEPANLDDAKRNLTGDHGIQRSFKLDAKTTLNITRPYFTRDNIETPVYKLIEPALRNAPASPPALTAWADLSYRGVTLRIGRVVHDGPQPVSIVPEASLSLSSHAQVLPDAQHSVQIASFLKPAEKPAIKPNISVPSGWSTHVLTAGELAPGETLFRIDDPPPNLKPILAKASAKLPNHEIITEGFRSVGYGNLPRTNFYAPATDRIVPVNLKIPAHLRIAYLPGTGDDVPAALASIGLTPTILKVSDLTASTLSKFDTVVLGVRTYNAHPDLHGAPTQALFDFARNGGNVLVQYQTPEFTAADAPYPLVDRNERVIDETAPVVLLPAENSQQKADSQTKFAEELLTTPNKITSADFDGWIEERGHGFLDTWDPHYTALTETHDPGAPAEHIQPQAPQRGGLITVQLGKGRWTYCAFALYRQLPEAVPGAFRLFVNLLNP
ncbi:MAG TPA: hypothetical protein VLI45_06605, partial [Acidobacteriaceae bacterium]|nr:hypothetical protein [Acidobacteriaceae bacterium]